MKLVYEFAKHCLDDEEFNRGGIPTKEKVYMEKLGWTKNGVQLTLFYEAICRLQNLQREIDT